MIGPTLGLYLGSRFVKSVAVVFFTIFALIYMVDFVELLRRSSDSPNAGTALVAWLALLDTPIVAEQILPFAVLFGAMAAFINLTRKLELVVARAAGVSVWQFLAPPLLAALGVGLVAIGIYNPLSATMKQRAELIEAGLFKNKLLANDTSMWIRQTSPVGQSILRAGASANSGLHLVNVTAFVFDKTGKFLERADADEADMIDGEWRLSKVVIAAPGVAPRRVDVYHLATNLRPNQVVQSFVSPESVPFWSLPRFVEDTEEAGLDAVGYRLRFQSLLALPALLAAMVLIAASFSLKLSRMGGVGVLVLGGVGAGFVLYVATKLVSDLGNAGVLSTPVAAWSPAIVANMLGALTLLNREDG
ncbi:LPS export ABC transporter permease LptG [Rhodoblastus acidophilus]|uniref:LPS export ABC transporter permease LptG n=1 Tax=Candidatus Rhodoblastus alkanivorans TaxID=2954117 RepID=A0ABS9Z714_9HYPH|nr:LPS export ABC transporter permease LptG [Candidatus Rhodoblastus alkanivorans]MCI4678746.1 LPS export ABC transporter permease LptG [Candidatus Rhodoblastus alkanivorans]MCI4683458.1 LPS export ABC transporter permease LptG [Candidatus Rhodoblastus alkanivorans]MDI4640772.1 LPS export ABC transporter permease LptG [Rhodoblastus acidophilus]